MKGKTNTYLIIHDYRSQNTKEKQINNTRTVQPLVTGQDTPENRNTNAKRISIEQAKNITFKADEKRVSMQKQQSNTSKTSQ